MRARSLAIWQAVRAEFGRDEIQLWLGKILVTVALWPLAARWCGFGQVALLPAGILFLWMAIPTRASFIAPEPFEKTRRKA